MNPAVRWDCAELGWDCMATCVGGVPLIAFGGWLMEMQV